VRRDTVTAARRQLLWLSAVMGFCSSSSIGLLSQSVTNSRSVAYNRSYPASQSVRAYRVVVRCDVASGATADT